MESANYYIKYIIYKYYLVKWRRRWVLDQELFHFARSQFKRIFCLKSPHQTQSVWCQITNCEYITEPIPQCSL